jgi:hypothetical protein
LKVRQAAFFGSAQELHFLLCSLDCFTAPFSYPPACYYGCSSGGKVEDAIRTLSKKPELAWLSQLQVRHDVQWRSVRPYYDQWNYKSEGLTQGAAAMNPSPPSAKFLRQFYAKPHTIFFFGRLTITITTWAHHRKSCVLQSPRQRHYVNFLFGNCTFLRP